MNSYVFQSLSYLYQQRSMFKGHIRENDKMALEQRMARYNSMQLNNLIATLVFH
jgi:CRISPR/Cas system-associated endoribonuclease Cas2